MVNMHSVATVYQYLVKTAIERRTTTYSELAELLGRNENEVVEEEAFSGLGEILNMLSAWLKQQHLPPLTALIVRASGGSEGQLSSGFWNSQGLSLLKSSESRHTVRDIFQRQCWDYYVGLSTRSPYIVERYEAYYNAAAASSPETYPRLSEVLQAQMERLDGVATLESDKPLVFIQVSRDGVTTREPLDKLQWMVNWFEENFEFSEDKRSIVRCKTDLLLTDAERRAKDAVVEVAILPINGGSIDFISRVFARVRVERPHKGVAVSGFNIVGVLDGNLSNLPFVAKYTGGHRGVWNFEVTAKLPVPPGMDDYGVVTFEIAANPQTGDFKTMCNDSRIHAITVQVTAELLES